MSSLPKVQFGVWHPLCAGTEMAPSGSAREVCVAVLYSVAREFAYCEELGFYHCKPWLLFIVLLHRDESKHLSLNTFITQIHSF